jgi:diazepam-binding inhibitor (GABA receptor modulating acyl-CoA-binding protein)
MSTLQQSFESAQNKVKNFTKRPNDDELLHLYGLFKQGTIGDINIPQPGMFAFKDKAKWNSWNEKKGMKKETAMQSYVDFVNTLEKQYK